MARVNLENAKALYPSCDMGVDAWAAFLSTPRGGDMFGQILYDIWDETVSQQERKRGQTRIGRRPRRGPSPLSEVMGAIFPDEYTLEPLTVCLPKMLEASGKTARDFASEIPVAAGYFSLLVNGRRPATLPVLEGIARALGTQPWFFREWRAIYISELVKEIYMEQPHIGITAMKRLRRTRGGPTVG